VIKERYIEEDRDIIYIKHNIRVKTVLQKEEMPWMKN